MAIVIELQKAALHAKGGELAYLLIVFAGTMTILGLRKGKKTFSYNRGLCFGGDILL